MNFVTNAVLQEVLAKLIGQFRCDEILLLAESGSLSRSANSPS